MNSQPEFERILTAWLEEQAPAHEPEGLLRRGVAHAGRARQEPGWFVALRGGGMARGTTRVSRLVWVLAVLGILLTVVLGAAIITSGGHSWLGIVPASPGPTLDSSLPQISGLPGRFAFASDRDGDYEIYTMLPDRTDLARLTTSPGDDVAPLWSPDGSRIAFASDRAGNSDIYVMDRDGTGLTRLTTSPSGEVLGAWSPDGASLAYAVDDAVHVIDLESGRDRRLPIASGDWRLDGIGLFAWLPTADEMLVVFDRTGQGGEEDIFRLRIADGLLTPIRAAPGDDGSPALSPDGTRVAFESDRNGGCLFVMDPDGSNVKRLTIGCSKGFPIAWAPDGSLIGWTGPRRLDADQRRDIFVIRPDGTGQIQLTDSWDITDLAWGPALP